MQALFEADKSQQKGPRLSLNDIGLLLSKTLALGCFAQAELIWSCAIRGIATGAFSSLTDAQLAPFILRRIFFLESFNAPDNPSMPAKEYETLLTYWNSEDDVSVKEGLLRACDFHTHRSEEQTSAEVFE